MAARPRFAVVREDPALELELLRRSPGPALVVASGGCTALTLKANLPEVEIAAFDLNPVQLEHVKAKAAAVAARDLAALNVESGVPSALNQCGEFEGLFRQLRSLLCEFCVDPADLESFFYPSTAAADREAMLRRWSRSPYWSAAFAVFFGDPLLHAMFGPAATQHAEAGSYPRYFQRVFERGLVAVDAARNPFLQHILLGRYLAGDAPPYVRAARPLALELIEGTLLEVPVLQRFSVISLSNIFDWSDDSLVQRWADHLARNALPGTVVLMRQLNNRRDLRRFFVPAFSFDDALGVEFLRRDRSLFYERIEVARRGAA